MCWCSVSKLCLPLCGPMDCSTSGFPLLHCLQEFCSKLTINHQCLLTFLVFISWIILPDFIPSPVSLDEHLIPLNIVCFGHSLVFSAIVLLMNVAFTVLVFKWFSFHFLGGFQIQFCIPLWVRVYLWMCLYIFKETTHWLAVCNAFCLYQLQPMSVMFQLSVAKQCPMLT